VPSALLQAAEHTPPHHSVRRQQHSHASHILHGVAAWCHGMMHMFVRFTCLCRSQTCASPALHSSNHYSMGSQLSTSYSVRSSYPQHGVSIKPQALNDEIYYSMGFAPSTHLDTNSANTQVNLPYTTHKLTTIIAPAHAYCFVAKAMISPLPAL
jgi:hypothetical protein